MQLKGMGAASGALLGLVPVARFVERVIGWASLPDDLRTWGGFATDVLGGASMFEVALLMVALACLALAMGFDPRSPFRKVSAEDLDLSRQAEFLAGELFNRHADAEHRQSVQHFQSAEAISKHDWAQAGIRRSSDYAEIARSYRPKVESVFAKARAKGLNIDVWAVEIERGNIDVFGKALMVLAEALRSGKIKGHTLRVRHYEQVLVEGTGK